MGRPPPHTKPRVLVVDDEAILRMIVVDFSEDAGFEVFEAANADEALAILDLQPDIRIVLTDVNMPGSMDGLRFASTMRDRWPTLGIIILSGFTSHADLRIPERAVFFSKPYDIDVIVSCMNQMLTV